MKSCVLRGNGVTISTIGRSKISELIHKKHPGICRMKNLAIGGQELTTTSIKELQLSASSSEAHSRSGRHVGEYRYIALCIIMKIRVAF